MFHIQNSTHISPHTLSHISSPLQSFCFERLQKLRLMTKCKADGEVKVRDFITVNFLTVVVLSQVSVLTGLTFYGINGNITSYNCQ